MIIETQTRQVVTREPNASPQRNCAPANEARWCPECAAVVMMVAPENAAGIAAASMRVVYQLIESGKVHFTETLEGVLLVCLNSLTNYEAANTLEPEGTTEPRSPRA